MWITINKNTIKSFIRKNKIKEIKIFLNWEFDGQIDAPRYINEERVISVENFLEDLTTYKERIYYDSDDDAIYVYSSVFSYKIIDEKFEELKKQMRAKAIVISLNKW